MKLNYILLFLCVLIIKKMLKNLLKIRNNKGTALITALLVMGVLTAISLSVSTLIVREISITRLAIDAGKAYYAAEAGVEMALLDLRDGEAEEEKKEVEFVEDSGSAGQAKYEVKSTANSYPPVEVEEGLMGDDDYRGYYDYLDINESVTIPLFVGTGEASEEDSVVNFVVQFFPNFEVEDLIFGDKEFEISGWDVLRWKVYGIKNGRTESINDFTAFATAKFEEGGSTIFTGPRLPSWFGTWDVTECSDKAGIRCAEYQGPIAVKKDVLDDGQTVYQGSCLQTQAREHYKYDEDGRVVVMDCYDIAQFLKDHSQNYLVLTNLMNPSVLKSVDDNDGTISMESRKAKSRLYYRVVTDKPMLREYAEIISTGTSGDSKIVLNMLRKRDSFMPVFNFALYHTTKSNRDTDTE